mmetsp:Transcript_25729/g.22833  ORF Transcript_25729/g.22833 Transcript_25729/m.22833 type:complete len:98 (+) Transcript_25729:1112-1405(+)
MIVVGSKCKDDQISGEETLPINIEYENEFLRLDKPIYYKKNNPSACYNNPKLNICMSTESISSARHSPFKISRRSSSPTSIQKCMEMRIRPNSKLMK